MTYEEFGFIGRKIFKNRFVIAHLFTDHLLNYQTEEYKIFKVQKSEYMDFIAELIGYFGEALYMDQDEVYKSVCTWSGKAANITIQYGLSLTVTLRIISLFRLVIWEIFTEELEQNRFCSTTLVEVSERFDRLIDSIFKIVGEIHEKHNLNCVNSAFSELKEHSAPVVPISPGVAILPVIGSIDSDRAKLIMQVSLNESIRLKLQYFILDLSGVSIIDSVIANYFFQIVKTLKLIGVEIIITGINPEIAATIVRLGLDLNIMKVSSSLENALSDLGFKQVNSI